MKTDNSISLIGKIRAQSNKFIVKELTKAGIVGLVPSHGDILITLFKNEEMTMTEIADEIHRDRSTVTTLVNKPLKFQYVSVRKNPQDHRSNIVSLTQRGKELEPTFKKISMRLYEIEYHGISAEDQAVFKKVLMKINDNFTKTN